MERPRVVIITGLSGAGRSTAADALEDLGYFCVDNMPPALLPAFAELCASNEATLGRVALVIDSREREFFETVTTHLEALTQAGLGYDVLYLEASTEVLVQRYSESRRRHPMADAADDVRGAIEAEREKLTVLPRQAAAVIDTSNLNVHQLRNLVREQYGDRYAEPGMQIQVVAFGYKYGVPPEVDLLFDVRFLPNPYYQNALRPLTGLDTAVRDFVLGAEGTAEFLERVRELLAFVVPAHAREGKSYLTIGIGCTGGRHRSVAIAAALADMLSEMTERHVQVHHRDLLRSES